MRKFTLAMLVAVTSFAVTQTAEARFRRQTTTCTTVTTTCQTAQASSTSQTTTCQTGRQGIVYRALHPFQHRQCCQTAQPACSSCGQSQAPAVPMPAAPRTSGSCNGSSCLIPLFNR